MKLALLLLALTLPLAAQSCSVEVVQGPPTFFSGDGGPATQAAMYGTESIAFDAKGNLYLAQTAVHRIRRITPDGIIQTVAGTGSPGFSGDGGPATQAQITSPRALAIDPSGRVYFFDATARIRRLNLDGTIQTVAGFGVQGFNAERGPGTSLAVGLISSMTATPDGSIYYYENLTTNARLRRLRPNGMVETVIGTSASPSPLDVTSTKPLSVTLPLSTLNSLASDTTGRVYLLSGNLLVRLSPSDVPSTAEMIARIPERGSYRSDGLSAGPDFIVRIYGGSFQSGTLATVSQVKPDLSLVDNDVTSIAVGQFLLASNAQSQLFLLPLTPGRGLLQRADLTPVAGMAFKAANTDGGPSQLGGFNLETRFTQQETYAADAAGNLLAVGSDLLRLWRITPGGTMNVIAGNGKSGSDTTTQPAKDAPLNLLRAVTTAPDKTIYIAENDQIRRIRPDGKLELVAKTRNLGPGLNFDSRAPFAFIFPDAWAIGADNTIYFRLSLQSVSGINGQQSSVRLENGRYYFLSPSGSIQPSGDTAIVLNQFLSNPVGDVFFGGTSTLSSYGLHRANRTTTELAAPGQSTNFSWNFPASVLTSARTGIAMGGDGMLYAVSLDAPPQRITSLVTQPFARPVAATPAGDVYLLGDVNTFLLRQPQNCQRGPAPTLPTQGLVNAANFGYHNKVSPGALVTLFGQNLGPAAAAGGVLTGTLTAPPTLGDGYLSLAIGSVYSSATQVSAILDGSLRPGPIRLTYYQNGLAYPYPDPVQLVEATPALFTAGSTGSGQAASLNQDGSANSAANPIARGQIIQLYGTGFGTFEGIDIYSDNQYGRIATPPYPKLTLPITVQIGGKSATVEYAGAAPGLLLGIVQLNIRIPADAPTGPSVPLTIQAGSTLAEQSLSIAIK